MSEAFADGMFTGICIALLVIGWAFIAAHIMAQTSPDIAESTLRDGVGKTPTSNFQGATTKNRDSLTTDSYK